MLQKVVSWCRLLTVAGVSQPTDPVFLSLLLTTRNPTHVPLDEHVPGGIVLFIVAQGNDKGVKGVQIQFKGFRRNFHVRAQ